MYSAVRVAQARADVRAGRRGQRPVLHQGQADLYGFAGARADLDRVVEDGEPVPPADRAADCGRAREHARGPGFRQGRGHEVGVGPVDTDTNVSRSCTVICLSPRPLRLTHVSHRIGGEMRTLGL